MVYDYEENTKDFNLSYFCPECKQQVRGIPLSSACYESSEISDELAYLIVRCPTKYCKLSFIVYDRLNREVRRVFPKPETNAKDYHSSIPERIREDFAEARRCSYADAYKGVVVMCRRIAQQVVMDKITDKTVWDKKLKEQIKALFENGFITKSLNDALHEVRHFGNFGAHPRDDGLDDITHEDAETVISLIDDLLVDLYVRPHKTAQLTNKRTSTKP